MCANGSCTSKEIDHTGLCKECDMKLSTCTKCNRYIPYPGMVFIQLKDGEETGRGHRSCMEVT